MNHTSCNCPAGTGGKCKHICALIYYINNEQNNSKTDLPQQWGKPSKGGELKYKKGKTIGELLPRKKQKTAIDVVEPVSHEDLISKYNILNILSHFRASSPTLRTRFDASLGLRSNVPLFRTRKIAFLLVRLFPFKVLPRAIYTSREEGRATSPNTVI